MLHKKLDKYIQNNINLIYDEIDNLIKIPSITDTKESIDAMEYLLDLSSKLGFKPNNHKNIIGISDLQGISKKQIGIIGHADIVPAGEGWTFDPFRATIKNGYLFGRGSLDDKAANIMMLHAIKFLQQENFDFKYSIRYLIGTKEETTLEDVDVYKQDFNEPEFTLVIDGDFPICYGEKGHSCFKVTSPKINNPNITNLYGGEIDNSLSNYTFATIKNAQSLKSSKYINCKDNKIEAEGINAHSAEPQKGRDSITLLCNYLLENNIPSDEERAFINFVSKIGSKPNGENINLNCEDDDFDNLTMVPTMIRYENNQISTIFDCRYPTSTNKDQIKKMIIQHSPKGSKFHQITNTDPLLVEKDSQIIKTLSKAYEKATNTKAKLFTIAGSTYACCFKKAINYGPYMEWEQNKSWVGGLHSPNEGISINALLNTFKIYVFSLINMMNLKL